ncbi:hypothetical protein EVJ58_g294 [Rhodofomes roseus]|uniref:Uncharacterized protein n=1 Tax=Rhodofomes roseus TaxID=34475 RepID=A0A4Y9Z742_9APHY|nr:hypothetical protein EVJ58_g294 [Rhodofomes roseus]
MYGAAFYQSQYRHAVDDYDRPVAGPSRATTPSSDSDGETYTRLTFPTSSSRGEHYVRPQPLPRAASPPPQRATYTYETAYVKEVLPGVLEDGRWLASHPFVARYLDALVADYERKTAATGGGPSSAPLFQEKNGNPTVGRPEDVGVLIGEELSLEQCHVVFTLAAVELIDKMSHKAHLALWNMRVRRRTVNTINGTMTREYRPVYFRTFFWSGIAIHMDRMSAIHNFEIRKATYGKPDPEPASRPKRAVRKADAQKAGGEQAPPAPRLDKGKAVDRGTPARVTAPRAKKPKAKPTASAGPATAPRRTPRRAATTKKSPLGLEPVVEAVTLEAKVEQMATPALATPAPEPAPNEAEADVDIEMPAQLAAPAPPPKRARAVRATTAPSRVSKRVAARIADSAPAIATVSPTPVPTPQAQGSATPVDGSPELSRSSTAVDFKAESGEAVVAEEPAKVAGKKRKVDDLADEQAPEPEEEEGPRRKSLRTATRKRTEKGEALAAELSAEKGVKRTTRKRR